MSAPLSGVLLARGCRHPGEAASSPRALRLPEFGAARPAPATCTRRRVSARSGQAPAGESGPQFSWAAYFVKDQNHTETKLANMARNRKPSLTKEDVGLQTCRLPPTNCIFWIVEPTWTPVSNQSRPELSSAVHTVALQGQAARILLTNSGWAAYSMVHAMSVDDDEAAVPEASNINRASRMPGTFRRFSCSCIICSLPANWFIVFHQSRATGDMETIVTWYCHIGLEGRHTTHGWLSSCGQMQRPATHILADFHVHMRYLPEFLVSHDQNVSLILWWVDDFLFLFHLNFK
jgi:hypothetical protein